MKNKKNYLNLACLSELLYILGMTLYLFLTTKNINDKVLSNAFFLTIDLVVLLIIYKESKKDLKDLKGNSSRLIFCSLWMLFDPVIPGVLGFIFINSLKEKKVKKLPKVKEEKRGVIVYVKSIIVLTVFMLLTFLLPNLKESIKIPFFVPYLVILTTLFLCYFKDIKADFLLFINNFKTYLPYILKNYLIMIGIMILVTIPIMFIKTDVSPNQVLISEMFMKLPFMTFILSVIYAPFVEEGVFRLALSKFFTNKTLFIVISGLLFGSLHIIDKFTSFTDLLYIFQYVTLGCCLSKAYIDSKNVFVSWGMHFIQNFLASILILALEIIK